MSNKCKCHACGKTLTLDEADVYYNIWEIPLCSDRCCYGTMREEAEQQKRDV
jgi:endogenous inhibitor of DNA gyrase (YacG/DUF329 family)